MILHLISVLTYSQIDTLLNTKFDIELENKWAGNRENFKIDLALKLNATDAGESYLSYPVSLGNQIEYSFQLTLNFAPSKSNYFRYYLWADSSNFSKSNNALFIEIGEDGSTDGINFYEKKGAKTTLLKKCFDSKFSQESINVEIKIKKNNEKIILYTLNESDSLLVSTNLIEGFTGIFCHYTVTRKDKYSIENLLLISEKTISNDGLNILQTKELPSNIYKLIFDKNISKYNLITNPKILNHELNSDTLWIQLNEAINTEFKIDLVDTNNQNHTFSIDKSKPFLHPSISITEIMYDPEPTLFLPNAEFIELTSNENLELTNWKLCDLSTCITLPKITVSQNESFILTSNTKEDFKNKNIYLFTLSNFISLNNEGDILKLYDEKNNLISWLEYNPKWIKNISEGGKSIEAININPCKTKATNWNFSSHNLGGTPGIFENKNNLEIDEKPKIISINDSSLTLSIGQLWNQESFSTENISIEFNQINKYSFQEPDILELKLKTKIEKGQISSVRIDGLKNCINNNIPLNLEFLLSEKPKNGEVVINEILQKSKSGVQFVEIKNISSKNFTANKVLLGIFKNGLLNKVYKPSALTIIPSNDFLVFTTDTSLLKEYITTDYTKIEFLDFYLTKDFEFGILNDGGELLEKIDYSILSDNNNINPYPYASWERVSSYKDITETENWLKAGLNANYGTPTQENSSVNTTKQVDEIVFSTKILKPNSILVDENTLEITTNLSSDNWILSLTILDRNGNLIDNLYQNIPISAKGKLSWNGKSKTGKNLEEDLYLLIVHLLNQNGDTRLFRKPIVIDQ